MESRYLKRKEEPAAAVAPQMSRSRELPFGMLSGYVPLKKGEARLYRAIREAVPLVDACVYKIIRLCGGVSAECDDPEASCGGRPPPRRPRSTGTTRFP